MFGGSQGGCQQRIEVFVKIQKKRLFFFFFFGGGGVGAGRGGARSGGRCRSVRGRGGCE